MTGLDHRMTFTKKRWMALLFCVLASAGSPSSANAPKERAATSAQASPYRAVSVPSRATDYYRLVWGVDKLQVRTTASGNLIRFSYRVIDPARARQLNDVRATPYLFGARSHALLQVPEMENIGKLRQTEEQRPGREYWMVFSNKGSLVKTGDRANVIIGSFHADGLVVE